MNANELADVLEDLHEQDKIDGVAHLAMPEAADMLRQQQAEIEALKGEVAYLKHINRNWAISEGWALKEIEALRNQLWDLKSEPWGFDRKAQEK